MAECFTETCLHSSKALGTLCPVCLDDPETRAAWEADHAHRQQERIARAMSGPAASVCMNSMSRG